MTLVVAFLGLGIVQAARWNDERLRASFAHDASSASLILATQLEEPLRALEALRGVFSVSRHLTRAEMRAATAALARLAAPSARWAGASGSGARTSPPSRRASAPRAIAGYRVFDRTDAVAPLDGDGDRRGRAPERGSTAAT